MMSDRRSWRSRSVYARSLILGSAFTAALAIFGSALGATVAGGSGAMSALVGAGLALVFMGLTAASILVATKVTRGVMLDARYFGIVIGTWLLKLVIFVGVAIWLGTQQWLNPGVFSVSAIVAVAGLLAVDVVTFQTSRVPYVDVALPGDPTESSKKTPPIL